MSYDLMSGYYHMGLFYASDTYVGFKWEGKYYVYNCLPFGLSTAPWVFLKVMRELVMHWRRGIRVLPYLDDFMSMERGFRQCMCPAGSPGVTGPLLYRAHDQCE